MVCDSLGTPVLLHGYSSYSWDYMQAKMGVEGEITNMEMKEIQHLENFSNVQHLSLVQVYQNFDIGYSFIFLKHTEVLILHFCIKETIYFCPMISKKQEFFKNDCKKE